jgi:hypothetical protein
MTPQSGTVTGLFMGCMKGGLALLTWRRPCANRDGSPGKAPPDRRAVTAIAIHRTDYEAPPEPQAPGALAYLIRTGLSRLAAAVHADDDIQSSCTSSVGRLALLAGFHHEFPQTGTLCWSGRWHCRSRCWAARTARWPVDRAVAAVRIPGRCCAVVRAAGRIALLARFRRGCFPQTGASCAVLEQPSPLVVLPSRTDRHPVVWSLLIVPSPQVFPPGWSMLQRRNCSGCCRRTARAGDDALPQ